MVPAEQSAVIKSAHGAWRQFQELGAQIAAQNRERWLRTVERAKQRLRTQRARSRTKNSND